MTSMRPPLAIVLACSALALSPQAASARQSSASCPAELAGWDKRAPAAAAWGASWLGHARLQPGAGIDATLKPARQVHYVVPLQKAAAEGSFGGMFSFTADRAGTYRIALGGPAWIDVVKDGKSLPTAAHGHGQDCPGIRKMVDFKLTPGRYTLQLSKGASEKVGLMVARLP